MTAGRTETLDSRTPAVAGRQGSGRLPGLPRSTLLRHALLMALAFLGVVLLLESTSAFRNSQLAQMAYYVVAAAGLTLLTGVNGQISLGHGAFMAVGAYTAALLLEDEVTLWVVFPVALVVTCLVGALVGVAAARLHGPYLAGVTLALAVGLPGLTLKFDSVLGGDQGLRVRSPRAPDWFGDLLSSVFGSAASSTKWLAYLGWAVAIVVLLLLSNLVHSRYGRLWRAVRDDEVAAQLAGINLARYRVLAFVVSAACAGVAGVLLAVTTRIAAPTSFTIVLSLSLLAAVVIGGLGSLVGAIIGAALLVFLSSFVTNQAEALGLGAASAASTAPLVYGTVLIVVMLLAPRGIAGTVRARTETRKAKRLIAAQG